jgi:hypothetical protein
MPGNNRDRTASCEAPRALPLSYVPLAGRGRTRTFDLMVSEVTALFTTGKGIAGERATSALGRQNAGLPCHHERPDSRRAGPRGTGSTVRFKDRRVSNPRFLRCEVSEVFTTSNGCPPEWGGDSRPRSAAENKRRGAAKPQLGTQKCINRCRGALLRNGAPPSGLLSSPPRHRWTARMPRAPFPPAGPALRTGAPKRHAVPGSGSPMPPKAADSGRSAAAGRHEKPLRSGRSGGVRDEANLSVPVSRSRSHEPGARSPTASRRRLDLRLLGIVSASLGSYGAVGTTAGRARYLIGRQPSRLGARDRCHMSVIG